MTFLLLLFILVTYFYLYGKMLTFPAVSESAHVKVMPDLSKDLDAVTVCIVSFATPDNPNAFLLFKPENNVFEVDHTKGFVLFYGLEAKLNQWNSICATWESGNGIAQVWVNGNPSARKGLGHGLKISGAPSIVLGQDQDSYGGGFDKAQSFVGMITDVHMWDSVLSYYDIALYKANLLMKSPGTVINWGALDFSVQGHVVVEDQISATNA
uniref:Pentraxin family member n=1 Tax=Denticeps clupeoides TaxID=299321 RepID=A0AAY4CP62_9TELE